MSTTVHNMNALFAGLALGSPHSPNITNPLFTNLAATHSLSPLYSHLARTTHTQQAAKQSLSHHVLHHSSQGTCQEAAQNLPRNALVNCNVPMGLQDITNGVANSSCGNAQGLGSEGLGLVSSTEGGRAVCGSGNDRGIYRGCGNGLTGVACETGGNWLAALRLDSTSAPFCGESEGE